MNDLLLVAFIFIFCVIFFFIYIYFLCLQSQKYFVDDDVHEHGMPLIWSQKRINDNFFFIFCCLLFSNKKKINTFISYTNIYIFFPCWQRTITSQYAYKDDYLVVGDIQRNGELNHKTGSLILSNWAIQCTF